ncbi:MAG: short-chain dehydrogenase [Myxococcales bacterium 68-20]|nr:SDR family oxidoreductase [Myxococcales bacterium]OJY17189.1 MAG: short-chain dehydrogenase [Myxococcales bacterium 68-20]
MANEATSQPKQTALVTGASAGIGKELAQLFAADGHDVVLVARSENKLEELAAELTKAYGVKAHVIAADLGDRAAPAAVVEQVRVRGLTVDLLVNNAGFGSNGAFLDLDLKRELEMIDVNVRSLVELTHQLARPMRARGFGRVMNIASTAGFQPGPYMATYYATKAFVVSFTEALAYELEGTGVSVTCYCPGATATEFATTAGNDKTRLFQRSGVAGAKEVAADAYRAMMKGQILSIHGALNWIGMQSVRFAPRAVLRSVVAGLNRAVS